jgi:hypothetical protein
MEAAEGIRLFAVVGILMIAIVVGGGILWIWNALR